MHQVSNSMLIKVHRRVVISGKMISLSLGELLKSLLLGFILVRCHTVLLLCMGVIVTWCSRVVSLIVISMGSVVQDFGRNSMVLMVSLVPAFMRVEFVVLGCWVRVFRVNGIVTSDIQTMIESVMMEVIVLVILQTMIVDVVMVWLKVMVVVLIV